MDSPDFTDDLDLVIARTGHERYYNLTAEGYPAAAYYRERVREMAEAIRAGRWPPQATNSQPLSAAAMAAARAYQAEQDHLWAAVLACPSREELPPLLPGEVRSCGCRAKCKAGKGGDNGMVGDHVCIECQRQQVTVAL